MLLIAIINTEVLIAINRNVKPKTSSPKGAVIPINTKIIETITKTIGVNIPKPICGKMLFLFIKSVFFANLGVNHKLTNHTRITVASIVPKDIK